jgi:hypothetical protein
MLRINYALFEEACEAYQDVLTAEDPHPKLPAGGTVEPAPVVN